MLTMDENLEGLFGLEGIKWREKVWMVEAEVSISKLLWISTYNLILELSVTVFCCHFLIVRNANE